MGPQERNLRELFIHLLGGPHPSKAFRDDLDGREVLETNFDGAYGTAGTVITLNGSPPRGIIVYTKAHELSFYIDNEHSRRLGKSQNEIVQRFLSSPRLYTGVELMKYQEPVLVTAGEAEWNFDSGYLIPFDRCEEPDQLVEWVAHMCEKTWCTTRHIRQFIALVESRNPGCRAYGC